MTLKHRVTLTILPSPDSTLQAFSPSQVSGTLTAMFGAMAASLRPSAIISSAVRATTSADTGPATMRADFARDFDDVAAGFQDQRGVGGDAVHHAQIVQLADGGEHRRYRQRISWARSFGWVAVRVAAGLPQNGLQGKDGRHGGERVYRGGRAGRRADRRAAWAASWTTARPKAAAAPAISSRCRWARAGCWAWSGGRARATSTRQRSAPSAGCWTPPPMRAEMRAFLTRAAEYTLTPLPRHAAPCHPRARPWRSALDAPHLPAWPDGAQLPDRRPPPRGRGAAQLWRRPRHPGRTGRGCRLRCLGRQGPGQAGRGAGRGRAARSALSADCTPAPRRSWSATRWRRATPWSPRWRWAAIPPRC